MADAYLGQIMAFAFPFIPRGWAACDGSLLNINQNTALYSLLGTYFGGNGTTTFALPDLRGRTIVGPGQGLGLSNYSFSQQMGVENTTLTIQQMPAHSHGFTVDATVGSTNSPAGGNIAEVPGGKGNPALTTFTTGGPSNPATLNATSVQTSGAGQAFSILQPLLVLNYVICLQGIYPSRS